MKYVIPFLFALALVWVGSAQADKTMGIGNIKNKPITIEGGSSPLMTVTFQHSSHRGIRCKHCHHETSTDIPYSSCRDCHSTPGARERDSLSMFMGFHSKMDRSCYGCHSALAEESSDAYPEFQGCRPCHISPQARKAATGKAAK